MIRVVFFGTPSAAVPTLHRVAADHDVALVVTQPDRPRGRSGTPRQPAIKDSALDLGLRVAQPETAGTLASAVGSVGPFDVGVVVAYGRILRPDVLAASGIGHLNVHFSLLPRWRGAAPVERAIMAGDTMSGVTIIELDEGMDTGPVLTAQAVDIGHSETGGALTARLAEVGARLLGDVLGGYVDMDRKPVPQTDEGASQAAKILADDRPVRMEEGVRVAVNRIRALAPTPGATLVIDGVTFKILSAHRAAISPDVGTWIAQEGNVVVGLDDGGLELTLIQPPGRNPQPASDWLRGARRDGGFVG